METFYWHDYETWGIHPASDRPSQFAGLRTDLDFNPLGKPLNIYCKPALDTLPHIEACLVTGITPQRAADEGVIERDFFAAIHSEMARAGTCVVGYNSLRFDDEVTRYGLYRNFYDPYAREWQHGNTRWDIIDMVRLCYAVRPQGLSWPQREDGLVSFKLEQLTAANGLAHESAHDALSDVYATLNLARLIKQQQPRLYDHLFQLRHKKVAQQALELGSNKPKLHISSRFGAEHACASLILPVVEHPVNKNEILCVDLRYSPAPLLELPAEELEPLQFTKVAELPAGIERIPLKSVHINRCPVVLSPGLIDTAVAERMCLDLQRCEQHRQQLIGYPALAEKLRAMAALHSFDDSGKVAEEKLYSGFVPKQDQHTLHEIPALNAEQLAARHFSFVDERLPDMLFRYRARNFPHSLTKAERLEWLEYCRDRLLGPTGESLMSEIEKIDRLLQSSTEAEQTLLNLTREYLQQQCATLNQAH